MPGHGLPESMSMHFGSDNRPFLTKKKSVPDYKHDYPFYMQPQSVKHVSIDVLDLDNPEDMAYYKKIWQAVGYGSVLVVEESKQWIEDKQNWKVFVRWCIKGKMDPGELRAEIARATRSLRAGPEAMTSEEGNA